MAFCIRKQTHIAKPARGGLSTIPQDVPANGMAGRLFPFFLLFFFLFLVFSLDQPLEAGSLGRVPIGRSYIELEIIGLHYMPLGWNIPLTSEQIPTIAPQGETEIYSYLLSRPPRFLVLETSVYPLPLSGIALKKYQSEFYYRMENEFGFNVIESATSSIFEEPWAMSLFFGNVVDFIPFQKNQDAWEWKKDPKNDSKDSDFQGKGYSGILVSYGTHHIRRNTLIRDDWAELEIKLIGSHNNPKIGVDWSYRIGGRLNFHPEIKHYVYIGLKRDRTDSDRIYPVSLWRNSYFSFKLSYLPDENKFRDLQLLLGKKWPITSWGVIPELTLGAVWKITSSYTGTLAKDDVQEVQFVISPNLRF